MNLENKVVVISGGAGALGIGICDKLIKLGAKVHVLDILEQAEGDKQFEDKGTKVTYHKCNCNDKTEAEKTLMKISSQAQIDVVCCHAGVAHLYDIDKYSEKHFDHTMEVNVRAAFILAQVASTIWIKAKHKGNLIFTSSWVHQIPWPGIAPYSASKAAVNALMRGFAKELASKGIRANCIAPGIVGAGMALKSWNEDKVYKRRASVSIPLGYLQPVESVADAFAFLCSDMSSYMTGSVLTVDGGCSLFPDI